MDIQYKISDFLKQKKITESAKENLDNNLEQDTKELLNKLEVFEEDFQKYQEKHFSPELREIVMTMMRSMEFELQHIITHGRR